MNRRSVNEKISHFLYAETSDELSMVFHSFLFHDH